MNIYLFSGIIRFSIPEFSEINIDIGDRDIVSVDMILVVDLETNSLNPSIIWVLGILNWETDEYTSYSYPEDNISEGLLRLLDADVLIFHNGLSYDIPVIQRLTEGLITIPDEKVIDTLVLSRKLVKMTSHSLDAWGNMLGMKKTKDTVPNFYRFWPEMVPYCEQDVRITKAVFEVLCDLAIEKNIDIFKAR